MLLEPEKVKKNTGIQKLLKIKSKTTTQSWKWEKKEKFTAV